MQKLIFFSILTISIYSCNTNIKNDNANTVLEEGTNTEISAKKGNKSSINDSQNNPILGFWVGYFEKFDSDDYKKDLYVDEGFVWERENKINISIDKINNNDVKGHSVVAGNDRPFVGTVLKEKDGSLLFKVKEPGDHEHDGDFVFTISKDQLVGTWTAYKEIDIKKRKYTLEKRSFEYNPDITLENVKEYVNWNKVKKTKTKIQVDENEFEDWIRSEFATTTDKIFKINASKTLLSKTDVENLKKGDLTIIRNTIYARHGYSFKNSPIRVFFDAQSWYIPVFTDIRSNLTELEKKNIQLLLRYEKNAKEYYDYFGRG